MISGNFLTTKEAEVRAHLSLTPEEKSQQNVAYGNSTYAPHDKLDLELNKSLETFYQALKQKSNDLAEGTIEIEVYPPGREFDQMGGPSKVDQTTVVYYIHGNGNSILRESIFEAVRDLSNTSRGTGTYEFMTKQVHGGFERDYGKVTISAKGILRRPELTAERIIDALNVDIAGRTRTYGI